MSGADKPTVDREAIRALVRQVLRDALPDTVREKIAADAAKKAGADPKQLALAAGKTEARPKASKAPGSAAAPPRIEDVSIANDGELAAFVRRLLTIMEDRQQRAAVQAGRLTFRLKQTRHETPPASPAAERIDKGLVTERKLIAAAKAGVKLVIAKGVVLTPLARDKARQLGVQIERE